MAAAVIAIADAVTAALNAATLSQSFVATRHYVPVHQLDDLADLKVTVVPASLVSTILDRGGNALNSYVIDVGVQKTIGQGSMTPTQVNAACDPLMVLAEEISGQFQGKPLAGFPQARCIEAKNAPIFVPAMVDELRVFTSVLSLTFRLAR